MPPLRTSGLAVASLVFGILAFFSGGLTGIVAVILGHMALSQIKRQPQELTGSGLAVAGLVTGYIGVAIAALVILTFGGLIFGMKSIGDQGRIQRAKADFMSLDTALSVYRLNARAYPTQDQGLQVLVEKPVSAPVPDGWVQVTKKLPHDPWGNPYLYRFPGSVDPTKPEIISSGPDGTAGTRDDFTSQKP